MNLGVLVSRHARYRGDHLGVVCDGTRLSWRDFNTRVNRTANALARLGAAKGERVAVVLPNRLEALEIYWACAKLGAVLVPLSPLLQAAGLKSLLADSDPVIVVGDAKSVPLLIEVAAALPASRWRHTVCVDAPTAGTLGYHALTTDAPDTEPMESGITGSDLFNICYSSGTTGLPKGITHSHDVRATYAQFAHTFRMTPESVVCHAGSIVFNGAWVTLMPAFYLGATYVLEPVFDAGRFIDTVAREGVTHVMLVPSQIIAILNSPRCSAEALKSLQMLCTIGAPLPLTYKQRLLALLPRSAYELYGLTEGFCTVLDRDDYPRKTGSVGSPPPFYELRIRDDAGRDLPAGEVGEIVGRSPILMSGYYKRPDLNAGAIRDGWLYSGDLGYLDEEGYLYLVDRKKDLIISGGVNVYPKDIEEILHQHPAVAEAAVFGAEDAKWGEVPVAACVLRAEQAVEADALKEWVNQRVGARYQRLADLIFLSALPRNVAGKTLKRELRVAYQAGRAAPVS